MVESALVRSGAAASRKLTVKALVSLGIVILAVALPQFAHLVAGTAAGVAWLPMYLPVLLGGCLMGPLWGTVIGMASPLVSYLLTSAMGSPMPAAARLPFMMLELAVFAVVAGAFSRKIDENSWFVIPAVLLAMVAGRGVFLLAVALTQDFTPFTTAMIWGQIKTGVKGLALQAVAVPLMVVGIKALLHRDEADHE